MSDLEKTIKEWGIWADATFGGSQRVIPILKHLEKEVPELIQAIELYLNLEKTDVSVDLKIKMFKAVNLEFADCFALLFEAANKLKIDASMINKHMLEKLEINKVRKWGKPDENGVVEHIGVE